MDEHREKQMIQQAFETSLSGLKDDPWLAQRVMALAQEPEKEQVKVKKKLSVGLVVVIVLLLATVTAMAVTITVLKTYDIKLYDHVEILNLLPEQYQTYDVCHQLENGDYLIGGFSLDGDIIAPMSAEDSILCLDNHFNEKWRLSNKLLIGGLFDVVKEGASSITLGMEQRIEGIWYSSIIRVSKEGSLLWRYVAPSHLVIEDIVLLDNEKTICVGKERDSDTSGQKPIILLLGEDGTEQWLKHTEPDDAEALMSICKIKDEIYVAGLAESGVNIFRVYEDGQIDITEKIEIDELIRTVMLLSDKDDRLLLVVNVATDTYTNASSQLKYYIVK